MREKDRDSKHSSDEIHLVFNSKKEKKSSTAVIIINRENSHAKNFEVVSFETLLGPMHNSYLSLSLHVHSFNLFRGSCSNTHALLSYFNAVNSPASSRSHITFYAPAYT